MDLTDKSTTPASTGKSMGGIALLLLALFFLVGSVQIFRDGGDTTPGVFGLVTGLVLAVLGFLLWKPWARRA